MGPNTKQQFLALHFALYIHMEEAVEKNTIESLDQSSTLTQRLFVERESICPLCGNELNIRIKNYLGNFTIAEEAFCDHCEMVTRSKDHRIN